MEGPRQAYRRLQARWSSVLAGFGVALVVLGVLLTLNGVAGNVVPTVLAVAGIGLLIAGMAVGTRLVFENFRYRRDQSFYDEDEGE